MKKILHILSLTIFCLASAALFSACSKKADLPVAELLRKSFDGAKNGDWKTALNYAQAAYKQAPDDTSVLILLALSQENQEQEQNALETIRKAAESDKKSFMAQYTYGRMLFQAGKFEQALIPLKAAYSLKPDDVNTLILLEKTSSFCKTRETFQYCEILWKDPMFKSRFNNGKNPFVMNEMGLYYATRKNPKKAISAFSYAERLAPDQPQIQLNLAIVYDYMQNDRAKAIPHYEKYLRMTSNMTGFETERLDVSRRIQEIR